MADEEDEINHGKIPLVRNSASEAWIITKGNVEDEGGNAKVSSIGDALTQKALQAEKDGNYKLAFSLEEEHKKEDGKEGKVNEHKGAEKEEEGGEDWCLKIVSFLKGGETKDGEAKEDEQRCAQQEHTLTSSKFHLSIQRRSKEKK